LERLEPPRPPGVRAEEEQAVESEAEAERDEARLALAVAEEENGKLLRLFATAEAQVEGLRERAEKAEAARDKAHAVEEAVTAERLTPQTCATCASAMGEPLVTSCAVNGRSVEPEGRCERWRAKLAAESHLRDGPHLTARIRRALATMWASEMSHPPEWYAAVGRIQNAILVEVQEYEAMQAAVPVELDRPVEVEVHAGTSDQPDGGQNLRSGGWMRGDQARHAVQVGAYVEVATAHGERNTGRVSTVHADDCDGVPGFHLAEHDLAFAWGDECLEVRVMSVPMDVPAVPCIPTADVRAALRKGIMVLSGKQLATRKMWTGYAAARAAVLAELAMTERAWGRYVVTVAEGGALTERRNDPAENGATPDEEETR